MEGHCSGLGAGDTGGLGELGLLSVEKTRVRGFHGSLVSPRVEEREVNSEMRSKKWEGEGYMSNQEFQMNIQRNNCLMWPLNSGIGSQRGFVISILGDLTAQVSE